MHEKGSRFKLVLAHKDEYEVATPYGINDDEKCFLYLNKYIDTRSRKINFYNFSGEIVDDDCLETSR